MYKQLVLNAYKTLLKDSQKLPTIEAQVFVRNSIVKAFRENINLKEKVEIEKQLVRARNCWSAIRK
jgi:hypothetical protein